MIQPKSYSVLEVLNHSDVGLLFEFYSTKESGFIVKELSSLIGKNITLTNSGSLYPSYSNAILLKEYEAKRSRYQFNVAQQNYHSVIPIINEVCRWISENCETSLDTRLNISLSFNHAYLKTLSSISQMNPTRLILKFDENEVYKRFPGQKNSPYALSIKQLAPITNYINESQIENNIKYILKTPHTEFYGINFKSYTQGILGCNYVGGKDYAEKPEEIKNILEYFILKTYQSINEYDYTAFEKYEMKRLTEGFDRTQMAYYDPEIFLKEFKDLKVYIDLKTSPQILKTYWNILRTPLFEMIINGGLREGQFNYDSQIGRFQLRKAKVKGISINNMDLVSCELSGIMENCVFVSCNLDKSRVYNGNFIRGNKIIESYLNGASINSENQISKSYVINNDEIVNCHVTESIIKFATPGKSIKIDEKSTLIVKQEPLPIKTDAIEIKEIRDYSFIKSMQRSENKNNDFANLYNKSTYTKR